MLTVPRIPHSSLDASGKLNMNGRRWCRDSWGEGVKNPITGNENKKTLCSLY